MPPEAERRTQMLTDICVSIGRHDERLGNLEDWQKSQNGCLIAIETELKRTNSWMLRIAVGVAGAFFSALVTLVVAIVLKG